MLRGLIFLKEMLDSFMKKETYHGKCHGAFVKPRVNGFCIGYSHSFKFNVIRLKSHRKIPPSRRDFDAINKFQACVTQLEVKED
jgi:hypothetical protein